MTTKTVTKPTEYMNGDALPAANSYQPAAVVGPAAIKLTGFQAKYMKRLIANFERAREQVQAIQASANDFIVACAEEEGIRVGEDGWQFDQENLEFVQISGGDNGNDS